MKFPASILTRSAVLALGVALLTLATVSKPVHADSPFCQLGSTSYNFALCSQYGLSPNPYCQTVSFNAAFCTQSTTGLTGFGNTSTSLQCQIAPSSQNCVSSLGSTAANAAIYCQVGSVSYNPTLCAQLSGTQSGACQASTFNSQACFLSGGISPTAVAAAAITAGSLNISAPPNPLNCGGSSIVTVQTNTQGASVSFTTSLGTISPPTVVDRGNGATAVFMAPEKQGGAAVITATSGTAKGTANITVNCAAAPAAAPAAVAPAAAPAAIPPQFAAPTAPLAILPPNTGDGGLLALRDADSE